MTRCCLVKGGILFPKRMLSFYLPYEGGEVAAPMALHGAKGVFSFRREYPLFIPQRKAYIAGLSLEELHALRSVGAVYMASP